MTPKYPNVKVKLTGEDGNAFFIIGRTIAAMRKAKISEENITTFRVEAMSGDYNHLLQTVMTTVSTR